MLRKIWLVAAQGVVLVAAALFLFDILGPKPALLPQAQVVTVKEAAELPAPDAVAVINATAELQPGALSEILVLRRGKETGLRIEVGRRPASPKPRR